VRQRRGGPSPATPRSGKERRGPTQNGWGWTSTSSSFLTRLSSPSTSRRIKIGLKRLRRTRTGFDVAKRFLHVGGEQAGKKG